METSTQLTHKRRKPVSTQAYIVRFNQSIHLVASLEPAVQFLLCENKGSFLSLWCVGLMHGPL